MVRSFTQQWGEYPDTQTLTSPALCWGVNNATACQTSSCDAACELWCCTKTGILAEAQHCPTAGFKLICFQAVRRKRKIHKEQFLHSRCISRQKAVYRPTYLLVWKILTDLGLFQYRFGLPFEVLGAGSCFKIFAILVGVSVLHQHLFLWTVILTKLISPLFLTYQNMYNSTAEKRKKSTNT